MSSYHGWTHAPKVAGGTDPIPLPAPLFIKVTGDKTSDPSLTTGDGQFIFEISQDMDLMKLLRVEAYVSTVSTSGDPTVQIRNITQGVDMLSTKVSIDANEFVSADATTPPVINAGNAQVAHKDLIAIDVDVAGTGAKGLGVMLTFGK